MVYLIWILAIISTTGLILTNTTDSTITSNNVLTLIGICTTLIVGIHFVDVMQLRDIEKRLNELNQKEQLIYDLEKKMKITFNATWGVTYMNYQPYSSLYHFLRAFHLALQYQDCLRAKTCLNGINKAIKRFESLIKEKQSFDDITDKDKISETLFEEMKKEDLYCVFKADINRVFTKINELKKDDIHK